MFVLLSIVQLKWLSEPNDLQASVGKSLHIPCLAEGNPMPKVNWYKNYSNLSARDKQQQQNSLGPELSFNPLKPNDGGEYECRASNGVEEDLVKQIKLDVLGKYSDINLNKRSCQECQPSRVNIR